MVTQKEFYEAFEGMEATDAYKTMTLMLDGFERSDEYVLPGFGGIQQNNFFFLLSLIISPSLLSPPHMPVSLLACMCRYRQSHKRGLGNDETIRLVSVLGVSYDQMHNAHISHHELVHAHVPIASTAADTGARSQTKRSSSAIAPETGASRTMEKAAVLKIQKVLRGNATRTRMKATLGIASNHLLARLQTTIHTLRGRLNKIEELRSVEFEYFHHHMKKQRRCLLGITYFTLAVLTCFSIFVNMVFGVKFTPRQTAE